MLVNRFDDSWKVKLHDESKYQEDYYREGNRVVKLVVCHQTR